MAAALNKIAATSPSRQHPSELETNIANALYDLESNIPDMKTALRPLQFVSAREVSAGFSPSLLTLGPFVLWPGSLSMDSLGGFRHSASNIAKIVAGFGGWFVPRLFRALVQGLHEFVPFEGQFPKSTWPL